MYILAGNSRIDNAEAYGETRLYKGLPRPALRVKVQGGLTPEQIQDMLANDWRLMDGEGEDATELSVQSGYCELESHEAVFIQMDALEVENNELKEEVQAVSSAIPSLLKGRDDDVIVEMAKYIPEWVMGEYTVGDVRKDASGYPKICVQAHNSITNPEHDITVASLWAPYHAKSKVYALPFVAVTGAHDMYKKGEWMVWTDGDKYECLQDTAYSPTDYAQAWQAV
ncbi:MAG: hypothetical protein ACOX6O_05720 [Christensenellales bacterium]|jgi:hypothetical protein